MFKLESSSVYPLPRVTICTAMPPPKHARRAKRSRPCPSSLPLAQELSIQSREEPLQLKLDTCKSIFFKPTWVGCSSTSDLTFHNPSRLPLEFEWRVSQQHQKMLAVQPSKGIIQPHENLVSAWAPLPSVDERVPVTLTFSVAYLWLSWPVMYTHLSNP